MHGGAKKGNILVKLGGWEIGWVLCAIKVLDFLNFCFPMINSIKILSLVSLIHRDEISDIFPIQISSSCSPLTQQDLAIRQEILFSCISSITLNWICSTTAKRVWTIFTFRDCSSFFILSLKLYKMFHLSNNPKKEPQLTTIKLLYPLHSQSTHKSIS